MLNILWFKRVKEITDNSDFQATPEQPWNPIASFAVYQKDEGWTEDFARKHSQICKCKGEFRSTASGKGFIAYMNAIEDNSSPVSKGLIDMLKA